MIYVLLWSQRQNALHVEPIEQMLTLNREAYRDNKAGDFRVLFVGNQDAISQAAAACRRTLAAREVKGDGTPAPAQSPSDLRREEQARHQDCGHGHVWPRADGVRARCGGPGPCSRDAAAKRAALEPCVVRHSL